MVGVDPGLHCQEAPRREDHVVSIYLNVVTPMCDGRYHAPRSSRWIARSSTIPRGSVWLSVSAGRFNALPSRAIIQEHGRAKPHRGKHKDCVSLPQPRSNSHRNASKRNKTESTRHLIRAPLSLRLVPLQFSQAATLRRSV